MSETHPTRTPAFEARLRKRYAAERRFKALGLGAILFSIAVLLFLLVTMTWNGIGGFSRTEVAVPVDFGKAALMVDPALGTDAAKIQALQAQGLPAVIDEAAKAALSARGIAASDLDAILVCTVTPDMAFPSTACLVQHRLGAKGVWGFDLVAACSGFVYGLTTAASLVMSGTHRKVLVIGADTMSRILDYTDRTTCILFGDGAGAVIVEAAGEGEYGYIGHLNEIDGSGAQFLNMPAGGSR